VSRTPPGEWKAGLRPRILSTQAHCAPLLDRVVLASLASSARRLCHAHQSVATARSQIAGGALCGLEAALLHLVSEGKCGAEVSLAAVGTDEHVVHPKHGRAPSFVICVQQGARVRDISACRCRLYASLCMGWHTSCTFSQAPGCTGDWHLAGMRRHALARTGRQMSRSN
jgi:hypothetical protein